MLALLNPCWRLRSSTHTPASASFKMFTIWLSEIFDFFMASSPSSILPRLVYFSLVLFYGRVTHGFLADRKAQNLTKGTIYFYKYNLKIFTAYCEAQAVKNVSQITPALIRDFLLLLEERNITLEE